MQSCRLLRSARSCRGPLELTPPTAQPVLVALRAHATVVSQPAGQSPVSSVSSSVSQIAPLVLVPVQTVVPSFSPSQTSAGLQTSQMRRSSQVAAPDVKVGLQSAISAALMKEPVSTARPQLSACLPTTMPYGAQPLQPLWPA